MKIVIAIDSFKGCATSSELSEQIEKSILNIYKEAEVIICPIADGGEGTVEALSCADGVKIIEATCKDPLGNLIKAEYIILENNVCVIEMASASGLPLVPYEKRNPSITTTYGTGDLIKDAISRGVREFIIGIGGSATNDAGLGMLQSLGYKFLDKFDGEVNFAYELEKIVYIDTTDVIKELDECSFRIACDVNNPLCGANGASYIYAQQKGADDKMILELDKQLKYFANIVQNNSSERLDNYPGSGAAGGLGFGFLAFLNAKLESGIKIMLEELDIVDKIKGADFVITGEGKIDKQSYMGKVISGIGGVCKTYNIPCIVLAGNASGIDKKIHELGVSACFSIIDEPIDLQDVMKKDVTLELIRKKTEQLFRLIKITTET